jgi:hypothetical protein
LHKIPAPTSHFLILPNASLRYVIDLEGTETPGAAWAAPGENIDEPVSISQ